jgi:hypothetical protein
MKIWGTSYTVTIPSNLPAVGISDLPRLSLYHVIWDKCEECGGAVFAPDAVTAADPLVCRDCGALFR